MEPKVLAWVLAVIVLHMNAVCHRLRHRGNNSVGDFLFVDSLKMHARFKSTFKVVLDQNEIQNKSSRLNLNLRW